MTVPEGAGLVGVFLTLLGIGYRIFDSRKSDREYKADRVADEILRKSRVETVDSALDSIRKTGVATLEQVKDINGRLRQAENWIAAHDKWAEDRSREIGQDIRDLRKLDR